MNKVKEFHLSLAKGELVKVASFGRTISFSSHGGSAWLTATDDSVDYILPPGGTLEIPAKAGLLLQSLSGDLEIDVCVCA